MGGRRTSSGKPVSAIAAFLTASAAAVGLALAPAAVAATPTVSIQSVGVNMTATTTFSAANATATCPAGTTLVGGGDELTRAGAPVPNDGAVTLGIYPSNSSGTQSTTGTVNPLSWTATGGYSGQAPGTDTVTSYAMCATGVTSATEVEVAATAAGSLGPVTAVCPSGTSLVGGGGGYTAFITGTNAKIYDSYPSDSAGDLPTSGSSNPTSWTVQGNSNALTGPALKAIALCATDVAVATQVATASHSVSAPAGGASATATVTCPANTTLLGGGIDVTSNPSGPGTGGQGVHIIGDYPSDASANPLGTGSAGSWTVTAQNGGQSLTSLGTEALGLCEAAPPTTPTCTVTALRAPGPSGSAEQDVTVTDPAGIASVSAVQITNGDVFTGGSTSGTRIDPDGAVFSTDPTSVVLTAVKTTPGVVTRWSFTATNGTGSTTHCA
jgi:hypothetical protein